MRKGEAWRNMLRLLCTPYSVPLRRRGGRRKVSQGLQGWPFVCPLMSGLVGEERMSSDVALDKAHFGGPMKRAEEVKGENGS